MKPETFYIGDHKMVSYRTGQLQNASPLMKWAIDALGFINKYNSLPLSLRKNKYEKKYSEQNDNYLINCSADEYGNGYELWLEVLPKSEEDWWHSTYSNENLKLTVTEYIHEEMEIIDIVNHPLSSVFNKHELEQLEKIGLKN